MKASFQPLICLWKSPFNLLRVMISRERLLTDKICIWVWILDPRPHMIPAQSPSSNKCATVNSLLTWTADSHFRAIVSVLSARLRSFGSTSPRAGLLKCCRSLLFARVNILHVRLYKRKYPYVICQQWCEGFIGPTFMLYHLVSPWRQRTARPGNKLWPLFPITS